MKKTVYGALAATLVLSNLPLSALAAERKTSDVPTYESETIKKKPRLQDDFYTNINYKYLTTTKLPEGYSEIGNLSEMQLDTQDKLKEIIKELNDNYDNLEEGSDEKKVIDFYNMARDFKTRDKEGLKPIQEALDAVKAVKSTKDLNQFTQDYLTDDYSPFAFFGVTQDEKDSTMNILALGTPSFGLKKVYYEDNDYAKSIQKAYKTYLKNSFVLMGYKEKEAEKKANSLYEFEEGFVGSTLSQEEMVDANATYNEMSLDEVYKLTSNLDYQTLFEAHNLNEANKIVVQQPKAVKYLNKAYTDKNIDVLKSATEMSVFRTNASALSKDVIKNIATYNAAYTGINHVDSDDELAFQLTEKIFGELLGKFYVERYFSPETKEEVTEMAQQVIDTYRQRLDKVDWLTAETKAKAAKKLDTMTIKIGYPDEWSDLSDITVTPYKDGGNLIDTLKASSNEEMEENFSTLNQAPDKSSWGETTPQTVNAFYSPTNNDITFTAAILQKPLYNKDGSKAENLGGVGAVIGHEVSHAFDSSGSQYDENGNITDWWTKEDKEKFQVKVDKIAKIYSALEAVKGHNVNGEISTGETMADLGGMTVALDIAGQENLDTKELFKAYARTWRGVSTKESLISGLTDEHPPGKFRVNNIVNLLDQFYTDFDVKEGDGMYIKPKDRLKVW